MPVVPHRYAIRFVPAVFATVFSSTSSPTVVVSSVSSGSVSSTDYSVISSVNFVVPPVVNPVSSSSSCTGSTH